MKARTDNKRFSMTQWLKGVKANPKQKIEGMAIFYDDFVIVRFKRYHKMVDMMFGSTAEAVNYCTKRGINAKCVQG